MALYTVTNGNTMNALDINQVVNLVTGLDNTTQVTVSNAIQSITPGCSAPSRYVGGTTSGAPTSGTFVAGDMVIAQDGFVWICATGGTPGTWYRQGTGDYHATATQTSAQTLTARSTQTGFDVLNLNSAVSDPHGMFSAVNHRFTIPFSGGTWLLTGTAGTLLAATTFSQAAIITKNGTAISRGSELKVLNGGSSVAYDLQQFNSGDLIQLAMYAEAAAAVNTGAGRVMLSLSLIA